MNELSGEITLISRGPVSMKGMYCITSISPADVKPYQIEVKYEGDESFYLRLKNVAKEKDLTLQLKKEESILYPLLRLFGEREKFYRNVKVCPSISYYKQPEYGFKEIPLTNLLNGEKISFETEEDWRGFQKLIDSKLEVFAINELKIMNELIHLSEYLKA